MTDSLVDRLRGYMPFKFDNDDPFVPPICSEAANVIEKLEAEAAFLCARLREFECGILDDDVGTEYYGHVGPSRARLEAALSLLRGENNV